MSSHRVGFVALGICLVTTSAYALDTDAASASWVAPRFGELVGVGEPERDEPPAESSRAAARSDLNLSGYVGAFGSNKGGGPMVSAALTWRSGPLQVGAAADAGSAVLGYGYFGYAAVAGLGWRSASGWQLDAVAVGGIHHYEGFGRGLLGSDPGASATLPFVGLRAGPSYAFGSGGTRFAIGVVAFGETDIASRTVAYSYMGDGWFDGPTQQREERTVWTARAGVALRLGLTHDLL